jgi:hypothetical protein
MLKRPLNEIDQSISKQSDFAKKLKTENSWTPPPPGLFADEEDEAKCKNCGSVDIREDIRQGYYVCGECGEVVEDVVISTSGARIFAEDSKSHDRIQHGEVYNPYEEYTLGTDKNTLTRDEKEFLWEGQRDIDDALSQLFLSQVNETVRDRAKELFNKSFSIQMKEKEGIFADDDAPDNKDKKGKKEKDGKEGKKKESKSNFKDSKRQRFSRKKQFVVTALCVALTENVPPFELVGGRPVPLKEKIWTPQMMNKLISLGNEVSDTSVKRCLQDLEIPIEFLFPPKK